MRYMDDLRLIHYSREYLKQCWKEIERKLAEIGFELNQKSTLYPIRQGVKFLQWRLVYTDTGRIVMRMNGRKTGRERRRIKKILEKEASGEFAEGTAYQSMISWRANASRGDEWRRQISMRNFYYTTKAGIENGKISSGQLPAS